MNNQIFHAGTYEKDKKIFSKGGRVLNITSMADKMIDAKNNSIDILKKIDWKDGFYRNDIGWRIIKHEDYKR